MCIEEDWSVERAEKVLEDELAKAWHDVDHFLLEKAFSSTAQNRQMEIKRLGGNVSAIIEKFPLLQKIHYIRICKFNENIFGLFKLIQ